MTTVRLFFALLLSCAFVSCGHNADLKYPSVAQADDMDVQWGLTRRKPRGGPKQYFNSRSPQAAAAGFSDETAPVPPRSSDGSIQAPSRTPAPAPAPAAPQPSVPVPANLR